MLSKYEGKQAFYKLPIVFFTCAPISELLQGFLLNIPLFNGKSFKLNEKRIIKFRYKNEEMWFIYFFMFLLFTKMLLQYVNLLKVELLILSPAPGLFTDSPLVLILDGNSAVVAHVRRNIFYVEGIWLDQEQL